jgi:hypothetical protein
VPELPKLLKSKEKTYRSLVARDLLYSISRGANRAARRLISPMSQLPNDYISIQYSRTQMTSPCSIDSRRFRLSKANERRIRRRASGLDACFDRVNRYEVTLEGPAPERPCDSAVYGVPIRISLPRRTDGDQPRRCSGARRGGSRCLRRRRAMLEGLCARIARYSES